MIKLSIESHVPGGGFLRPRHIGRAHLGGVELYHTMVHKQGGPCRGDLESWATNRCQRTGEEWVWGPEVIPSNEATEPVVPDSGGTGEGWEWVVPPGTIGTTVGVPLVPGLCLAFRKDGQPCQAKARANGYCMAHRALGGQAQEKVEAEEEKNA